MKRLMVWIGLLTLGFFTINAQNTLTEEEQKYIEVLKSRSEKILDQYVKLPEGDKRVIVTDLMVKQYWNINKVIDTKDALLKNLTESGLSDRKINKKRAKAEIKTEKKLKKLQKRFLKDLSDHLNDEQIDGIKDGMTLGALNHNYRGFTEMIPSLTREEKDYIYNQLLEARDKAMNMGSAEDKQAVFRQYKGRINNYLSNERGYDLKKEGERWQQRIKK